MLRSTNTSVPFSSIHLHRRNMSYVYPMEELTEGGRIHPISNGVFMRNDTMEDLSYKGSPNDELLLLPNKSQGRSNSLMSPLDDDDCLDMPIRHMKRIVRRNSSNTDENANDNNNDSKQIDNDSSHNNNNRNEIGAEKYVNQTDIESN